MSVGIFGGNNSIMDHCSMSWAIDEVLSSFGSVHNLTVQWSIVAEGLSRSFHPKGEHSKGSILDGDGGMTLHHCLYAHNSARNARVNTVVLDFRNNIVYNWGYRGGYTTKGPSYINYVNNYFQAGPSTRASVRTLVFEPGDNSPRLFFTGNVLANHAAETADNRLLIKPPSGVERDKFLDTVIVNRPFTAPSVATDSAAVARDRILADAGAILPHRDSADRRLMDEVRTGSGRIINSPTEVGGWPKLNASVPPTDGDNDGMPDVWERRFGFDPISAVDGLADADADGYPNLEEFLNGTNPNLPEPSSQLEAASFQQTLQAAMDQCAQGRAAFKARMAAEAKQREAARNAALALLEIRLTTNKTSHRVTLGELAEIELAPIPAGTFLMGSRESEGGAANEHPQHQVTISRDFYMSTTLITNRQFSAVMGSTIRRTRQGQESFPAHEVTWFEGVKFCELLSLARMPR